MDAEAAYRALEDVFRRRETLADIAGQLRWDSATMMPRGGGAARSAQVTLLEVMGHEILNDPAIAERLDQAEAAALDPWQQANLVAMRREWIHATALPADLVAARAEACAACELAWRSARPARDFKAVLPQLRQVVALTRQAAEAKAAAFGGTPYEALLDQYEPGARVARIDALFDQLVAFLPDFTAAVVARQAAEPPPIPLPGPFPLARQRALAHRLMGRLGFDFDHGRLDVSDHPFCGGIPEDVRITTRYDESDVTTAMMAVLHETGHALYERHLPRGWRGQPVGRARGMVLHESQSLLIEMQVCRGPAFLRFVAEPLRAAFDGRGPAWAADNLQRLYTRVSAGTIRVDADEVTYPAHVILRTRLERALIDGSLDPGDLPGAWAEGMAALLGVVPVDDRAGCLQDIHWYYGIFGYFPTYTLGALAAAQIFAAARAALPDLAEMLARGEFAPLIGWLAENIHGSGARLMTDALIDRVSGAPLGVAAFCDHLRARYAHG